MPRNNQRGGRNNNPSGRNQYSSDWMDTVRERPMASAAAAAAAVGAGVFLWSKRNQISEQIGRLSDQISDWSEQRGWSGSSDSEMAMADESSQSSSSGSRSGNSSGRSAKSRTSAGRAMPQSTTM